MCRIRRFQKHSSTILGHIFPYQKRPASWFIVRVKEPMIQISTEEGVYGA
jgi:hypothetical protein